MFKKKPFIRNNNRPEKILATVFLFIELQSISLKPINNFILASPWDYSAQLECDVITKFGGFFNP